MGKDQMIWMLEGSNDLKVGKDRVSERQKSSDALKGGRIIEFESWKDQGI